MEFQQSFTFFTGYKKGTENVVAEALSKRCAVISVFEVKLLTLQSKQVYYSKDLAFKELVKNTPSQGSYLMQEGFLFKVNRLCVPSRPSRELLVRETREGSLIGHFRLNKTLDILKEHFY